MFAIKQVFDEDKRRAGIVVYEATENGRQTGRVEAQLDGDTATLLSLSVSVPDTLVEDSLARAVLARCETLGAKYAVVPERDEFAAFRLSSAMVGERAELAAVFKCCDGCSR